MCFQKVIPMKQMKGGETLCKTIVITPLEVTPLSWNLHLNFSTFGGLFWWKTPIFYHYLRGNDPLFRPILSENYPFGQHYVKHSSLFEGYYPLFLVLMTPFSWLMGIKSKWLTTIWGETLFLGQFRVKTILLGNIMSNIPYWSHYLKAIIHFFWCLWPLLAGSWV